MIYDSIDKTHILDVRNIRHKVSAHTDVNYLPQNVYEEVKLTFTELISIMDKLEEIMQQLSISLNVTRIVFLDEIKVKNEQESMFEVATKGINRVLPANLCSPHFLISPSIN